MECSVCYNKIKKSCITCHELCNNCYDKIDNNLCPLCRQQMTRKYSYTDIGVEYVKNYGCIGFKIIKIHKLKEYIFSENFGTLLALRLKRQTENIFYTRKYIMIKGCKYDYDELLPLNNPNKFNAVFYCLDGNVSNPYWLMDILCKLKKSDRIEPLDIFTIRNHLNSNYHRIDTTKKEILQEFWDKYKSNYGY